MNVQNKFTSPPVTRHTPSKDKENNCQLTDKLWEYHDPTPNIHDLFILFDKKFFWSTLGMVEVKWSSRMTTCAGLCSYQGKRGLCSIRLSAPLLSLRPRKDLVETLLHEMIHAYLFVTDNYRDRDDHGPQFHKHMYRINREAGTNITVYHSFHDEVAYHQKHIWRCNGPCQNRRPYFGFVRRAMNRAPGPNDTWWKDHQFTCGGAFIKVSEPEKPPKKKRAKEKLTQNKSDGKTPVKVNGGKDIREFFPNGTHHPKLTNYHVKITNGLNIYTLKDLNKTDSMKDQKYSLNGRQSSQTFVIPPGKEKSPMGKKLNGGIGEKRKTVVNVKNKAGTSQESCPVNKLPSKALDSNALSVKETVRNVWAKKYPSSSESKGTETETSPTANKQRQVTCPVCDKAFGESEINEHLDECLLKNDDFEDVDQEGNNDDDIDDINTNDKGDCKKPTADQGECPVCAQVVPQGGLNEHFEICLKTIFGQGGDEDYVDGEESENVPCPCCMKWVPEKSINSHIDECLTLIALKNGLKSAS